MNRMYQIAYFCFSLKLVTAFSYNSDNIILYLFVGLHTISDSITLDGDKIGMALFYAHKLIQDLSAIVNLTAISSKLEANIHRVDILLRFIKYIDKNEKTNNVINNYEINDSSILLDNISRFHSNEIITVSNLKVLLNPISNSKKTFGGKISFIVKRYQSFGITGISGKT